MNKSKKMLSYAYNKHFAIMAINFESFETLKALVKGAAENDTPIIVQTTEVALREMGIKNIVYMVQNYEDLFQIPVLLHLDHAVTEKVIRECIDAGYSSVMIDASEKGDKDNIAITRRVVEYAHSKDVLVEGEMGVVGINGDNDLKTDTDRCICFAKETDVDSLAVSVGNSHGGRRKVLRIDFELLKEINSSLHMPLVLHGSSGVVNEDLESVMKYGVCKINIETELRMLYRKSLVEFLERYPDEIKIRKVNAYLEERIAAFVGEKSDLFKSRGMGKMIWEL